MKRFALCSFVIGLATLSLSIAPAQKTDKGPAEADYYKILRFELPKGEVLEMGALEWLPNGKLAFSTRRGEIWIVDNPLDQDPTKAVYKRFAHGLHEVLGLGYKDGWIYATQRGELTRLKDSDKDGVADTFETVNDGWEINGDYHEYAFGSRFDKKGDVWVVLCLTGSFTSNNKFRGWCVRITPEGKLVPTCSGIRSPGGIGMNADGDVFYTDNQGPWNGTSSIKHLVPNTFQGHPDGNRWFNLAPDLKKPETPKSKSRMMVEAKRIPELMPPAIYFPYGKMGQSASGIACDTSGGKFGPFEKQLFVGDQTHSTVMRCCMEKVQGRFQGACFPFVSGIGSGSLPCMFAPDGSLFVGGTNRGWGSRGNKPFSLDRIVWTGKTPFEIHEMRLKKDGFELTFTQPVDPKTAADAKSYAMKTYCYIYQADYGSPEVDHTTPTIDKVEVASDNKSVRLYVSKLQEGHIHELTVNGVKSADGLPVLHPIGYYTLNYFVE